MDKLNTQPFIDARGNLVLPGTLLEPRQDPQAILVQLPSGLLRVSIEQGRVIRVEQVDQADDDCADLVHAASSSLAFWDNPEDAAAWNKY